MAANCSPKRPRAPSGSWSVWSPSSACSTVPSETDAEAGRFAGCGKAKSPTLKPGLPTLHSNPALEQPLMSAVPADRPGTHARRILALPALVLGVMIGVVGTLMCNVWAPRFTEALRMSISRAGDPELMQAKDVVDEDRRQLFQVQSRNVWVYPPAKASELGATSLPAVIVLHGSKDTPLNIAKMSRFEEVAELANETFLTVFPEMATPGGMSWGYNEDLAFFRAVIDMLDQKFSLKRGEVYVCGHSAGGTMSLHLQNNAPELFRGAAAVEAGVGHEDLWSMQNYGKPTMLIWNNNDPVLKDYNLKPLDSIKLLRRHDTTASGPSFMTDVPLLNNSWVSYAKRISWGAVGSTPPTIIISWETRTPTHAWSNDQNIPGSFNAAAMIWDFFLSINKFDQSRSLDDFKGLHQFNAG